MCFEKLQSHPMKLTTTTCEGNEGSWYWCM